ncbi:putative ribonuclease H-like domain-containing protein, partial [Tanacetum coccineum]
STPLLPFRCRPIFGGVTVYVSQPPGFVDPGHPNKVYKVVKALYGLHQAPRAWYATLSTFLEKHGYKRGTIDKTLFIKRDKKDIMLVQVYVDDIIFGSTNKSWCDEFEALMKSRFQMSSMGELTFFLGLQVKQNKGGIFISQDKYVAEILKKFDLVNVKASITPMETKVPLTKDEEAIDVDVHLYRSMIGSLMYLTASRPDIMYAVCVCLRFQVTPKTSHLNAVKRIFKYLKGKPNLGLWYPRESPFDLEAFSDSDYGGLLEAFTDIDYGGSNLDMTSITGGCQFLGQRLISWQCKKQTIVATSTTEAEYVAAANCCGQVLWVQNQLLDYGFNFMNTKIHIDNESTICIVKNPVYHSKTKHIEIRHHFIRDCYEKKLIQVQKIHTDLNVADLLTKPFDGPRFNFLLVNIGMVLLGVGKDDAGSTWTWKRTCQLSLANWMQIGCKSTSTKCCSNTISTCTNSFISSLATHSSITKHTHLPHNYNPVQSTSPPPQPSSVQPTSSPPPIQPVQTTSSPPITAIPDTQPTLPPSPQIPSPSYHDTEGPSFEPSYHMSPPPSHEPEIQTSRPSEETILQLIEKVKKLENKLRQKRKSEETEDAEGQDQEVPSQTDQGNAFATPEKSKDSGEAQADQISPSTLEAAQILTNVASEGFKGSQAPLGSKIYRRKPKSTPTPTKILHFEEPAETQVNTGSTPSAQVNTAEVNTAEVNTAELNTGETERVQRRKGKDPMTEEDLQAEVQASKKSKELQELAGLEAAQRLQATMDAETQRQIDLDALLARRLVEQEEEAAKEALATEFDYIQARLNADQIFAEKIQQEEREQYSIEERAKFLHDTIAAQRKFLAEQRNAAISNQATNQSLSLEIRLITIRNISDFCAIGCQKKMKDNQKMNEQAADKEKEHKNESFQKNRKKEVKEEEGAKKRKEDDDLKMCLHIAPDEDKVVDVEILDHQYPIVEWQSFFLTTKPQFDPTKPCEVIDNMNRVTRRYPLTKEVLSQMLELKLETEEEKHNDYQSFKAHSDPVYKDLHSGFKLTGFSNADYVGCRDSFKSTSGGTQFLGEKLVGWSSKKQDCTTLSTTEAEYVSLPA